MESDWLSGARLLGVWRLRHSTVGSRAVTVGSRGVTPRPVPCALTWVPPSHLLGSPRRVIALVLAFLGLGGGLSTSDLIKSEKGHVVILHLQLNKKKKKNSSWFVLVHKKPVDWRNIGFTRFTRHIARSKGLDYVWSRTAMHTHTECRKYTPVLGTLRSACVYK